MATPDRGKKRTCPSCGAVFYDLNRTPIICPKCETEVEVQSLLKPRRPSPQAQSPKPAPKKPVVSDDDGDDDDLDVDLDVEDEDEDDDLIEDLSDIGDDDEDMSEVKEHIGPEGGDKE